MTNRRKPYMQRRNKENEVNKKAIIWIASIFAAIVVILTVLLIIGK